MNKEKLLEELEKVNKICEDTIEKIDDYLNKKITIISFPIVGMLCPICKEKAKLEWTDKYQMCFSCKCGERFVVSQSNYKKINYINVRL